MSHGHTDVLVVGAGIVGAACAHELARAGLSVHVVDARLGGATQAGMGHLVVMDDNTAELALSSASLEIWREWGPRMNATETGCAYTGCGTMWIAANEEEMAEAERKQARLRACGVAATLLNARQLADAEPALRTGLAGALQVPGDGLVYAPSAARWLLAQAPPTLSFEAVEVRQIDTHGAVLTDGSRRDASAVVLAAGMPATRLCADLPLHPKKGHLAITDRYPFAIRHQLVELGYMASTQQREGAAVAFNVQPRPTGQLLIGSSRQVGEEDPAVEPAVLSRMLKLAIDYLPALSGHNILRTWTGVRAATPDGLPLVGRHPTRESLWLAVGHEGLGVTTAPATAKLLTALMTGAPLPLDAAPLAATRHFDKATT
ncbi:FAD-binding oxidoreductase [Achromobacter sp. UMC46]|uniref:NAD(P)/FAD-dependent oxidoreductase n=1 Tax=Achromobacter sp. UMC46 TaxID=1862319 RepID=UPI00160262C1|nr:FAD-dependent oxidoreductase [Achromobacter sp. UMC46]MBB1597260.1 D-amino-acid oxidase [Achromobacter sp. UMC46]